MNNSIIKIYGLRQSGSNWLQWLLEKNVNNVVLFRNQLAWKHGNPTYKIDWSGYEVEWDNKSALGTEYPRILESIQTEKLLNGKRVIDMKPEVEKLFNDGLLHHAFIVKNPYNWLISRVIKRNGDLKTEITDWNERIKSYFDFDYPSKIIISYEKLNINPVGVIQNVCNTFNLEMKQTFYDTDKNLTHNYSVSGNRIKFTENDIKNFRKNFNQRELDIIDNLLDNESLKLYNSL